MNTQYIPLRAMAVGCAMVIAAATNALAGVTTITAVGTGELGEAVRIQCTFSSTNLPANTREDSSSMYFEGENWLAATVSIDGVLQNYTIGSYAFAFASTDGGDSLVIGKVGADSGVYITIYSEALYSGVPQFPPANQVITFGAADFAAFDAGSVIGMLQSVEISSDTSELVADDPISLLEQLSEVLGALTLDRGTANSLDSKLENVLAALLAPKGKDNNAAINQLSAFINSVYALRGKKITTTDADELIRLAEDVIAALSR